jgi:hypothetical protein
VRFDRRYTDAQRDALVEAYVDRGVRPARRVAELAAAGELTHNGEPVERFTVPVSTVRSLARDARRHRHSTATLDSLAPRDAVERLRLRLIRAIDRELNRVERRQRAGEPVKGEELRQLARAQRELAQIPGLRDPLPPAPGAKVNGVREGGETRGGLAGPMMRDLRSNGAAGGQASSAPSAPGAGNREGGGLGAMMADLRASQRSEPPPAPATVPEAPSDSDPEPEPADTPGALVQERVTRLRAEAAAATPQPDLTTEAGRPSSRLPTEPGAAAVWPSVSPTGSTIAG